MVEFAYSPLDRGWHRGIVILVSQGEETLINEIVFEVSQEADGGFTAECLTESIFTEADSWEEIRTNVREAVEAFYFDRPKPNAIRLHLVRDEMLALG